MDKVKLVAQLLLIVGGLNWGLVALADFNIVTTLFGVDTTLAKVVYILVGLSAVISIPCFIKWAQGGCSTKK